MMKDVTAAPEEDVDFGERFARLALRPGGPSRQVAIQRAQTELARLKPELSRLIATGCRDLEAALLMAKRDDQDRAHHIKQAYAISESLRDVAGSLGFSFVGLIASNLCTIFEAVSTGGLPYPRDIIGCHLQALQLAQANVRQDGIAAELQEVAAGLTKTMRLLKSAAASAPVVTDPSDDHVR
jgi:chemotaxis protein histidine kinase CheA